MYSLRGFFTIMPHRKVYKTIKCIEVQLLWELCSNSDLSPGIGMDANISVPESSVFMNILSTATIFIMIYIKNHGQKTTFIKFLAFVLWQQSLIEQLASVATENNISE